jgi:hypothetical protein
MSDLGCHGAAEDRPHEHPKPAIRRRNPLPGATAGIRSRLATRPEPTPRPTCSTSSAEGRSTSAGLWVPGADTRHGKLCDLVCHAQRRKLEGMTLIAGFRAYGVPMLLGDFLLTSERREAGLRKKVRRLRPSCVVAWTGALFVAERVLLHMDTTWSQTPTREELDACLLAYDSSGHGSHGVHFIGWVIDEAGEHSFRWSSGVPLVVFDAEPAYDGTGAETVSNIAGPTNITEPSNPHVSNVENAIQASLRIVTQLMGDESFARRNRLKGFGHYYELLCWTGDRFDYVDDVLCAIVVVPISDDEQKIENPFVAGSLYKYRAFNELAVIDMWEPAADPKTSRSIYPVTAAGHPESMRAALAYKRSFELTPPKYRHYMATARHHCLFIQFASPTFVAPPLTFVQGPEVADRDRWLYGGQNRFTIRLPDTALRLMFRMMREYEETGRVSDETAREFTEGKAAPGDPS